MHLCFAESYSALKVWGLWFRDSLLMAWDCGREVCRAQLMTPVSGLGFRV